MAAKDSRILNEIRVPSVAICGLFLREVGPDACIFGCGIDDEYPVFLGRAAKESVKPA